MVPTDEAGRRGPGYNGWSRGEPGQVVGSGAATDRVRVCVFATPSYKGKQRLSRLSSAGARASSEAAVLTEYRASCPPAARPGWDGAGPWGDGGGTAVLGPPASVPGCVSGQCPPPHSLAPGPWRKGVRGTQGGTQGASEQVDPEEALEQSESHSGRCVPSPGPVAGSWCLLGA